MGSIGILEITLIFLLIILIYGGKKLPELARGLGLGLKEFKKATSDIKKEVEDLASDNDESVK
tara:strand:- start:536 stop:724 length:189 start_codon:yes stop_codon:yes gene_type:complete